MSIRLTQVELQSEEDTVIFLASGHLNCVEQVKPLLEAENFLEDHDGEDIEVSLSHYLYGDEGPAYDADQNHIRLIQAVEDTPDWIGELGNFLLQHARLVDELMFTIPGQPNEQPYTLPPELSYFIDQLAEEIVLSETIPTCRLCSIGECQSQVGGLVCRNAVKAWLLERAKRYLCPKAEAKTGDKRE